MGWLEPLISVAAGGAAANAKGNVKGDEVNREVMKDALAEAQRKRKLDQDDRELGLKDRQLTQTDRERNDNLNWRRENADAQRASTEAIARENRISRDNANRQSLLDRGEARAARTQMRPDQITGAQNDFADQYVTAAGGDIQSAMRAAERDHGTASTLKMNRAHYYAASQRFKDRFTAKAKAGGAGGAYSQYEDGETSTPTSSGPVVDQSAYNRAIAAGHSDADIAKNYTIPSTIRRKR